MDVIRTKGKKELLLDFDGGIFNGKMKTIQKKYSNIATSALDANVHAVAVAIVGLQTKSLLSINVRDTDLLTEE